MKFFYDYARFTSQTKTKQKLHSVDFASNSTLVQKKISKQLLETISLPRWQ
jgi:hypothetical protein